MNRYGNRFRVTLFGESHGPAIGVVLDGLPAGIRFDAELVREALRRRRPGFGLLASSRQESDEPEILSGLFRGRTTGAPLAIVIKNRDARSKDYRLLQHIPRPGHADLAAWMKYGEWRDWRGGGHFSGRMTAPLVVAGSVALMMPWMKGVGILAHTIQIGQVIVPAQPSRNQNDSHKAHRGHRDILDSAEKNPFCHSEPRNKACPELVSGFGAGFVSESPCPRVEEMPKQVRHDRKGGFSAESILCVPTFSVPSVARTTEERCQVRKQVRRSPVGCADARVGSTMIEEIMAASAQGDSVGGIIECIAEGVRGGLGAPLFGSVEGAIAGAIFAIPAVKGIEFGAGFAAASMRGSEHNDPIVAQRPANGAKAMLPPRSRGGLGWGSPSHSEPPLSPPASGALLGPPASGAPLGPPASGGKTTHERDAHLIATTTNNAGGILGGITTGMPIVFRVAFKPTPSISLPQQTIDLKAMEDGSADAQGGKASHGRSLAKVLRLKGRHDPCIVPRALPVVEACAAIAIANLEA